MVATTTSTSSSDAGSLDPHHHVAFTAPPSSKRQDRDYAVIKLFPSELRFVTGVARAYDDDFPPELSHLIQREDFETAVNQINNTLKDYWPCAFCVCWGYLCCPCTLGVSLLCPNLCIKDVRIRRH